jgi:RNA recognition motif-containing protein
MAKKLFVGNLAWGTNDDSLRTAFGQFGEVVSAQVLTDRETGRSRGFGFVEMADDTAAETAIAQLNGTDLDGRQITVNEARPMGDRPPRRENGDGGGFGNRRF